ncbi:MAG: sigma-E factor negative regulatory protein [Rhodocyclaceae bacterium]|nr:sigma-E factor negative regulatory protein [Rhodocyclaceae bacterium]
MTQEISAFMDGETEATESTRALESLRRDEELRRTWDTYHLVGAALRREGDLQSDLAPRVMAGLRDEPVVLAPRPRPNPSPPQRRAWMALAASAAGAAFGLWLALTPSAPAPGPALAARMPAAPVAGPGRIQEYLVAHQTYAPSLNPQGGTRYIRTVAMSEGTSR